jgi:hypothetical protein
MQLSAILQWEIQEGSGSDLSSIFQIYDENGSRICLCQFVDGYLNANPSHSLNSYFSNGLSCKKPEKNMQPLKYLDTHGPEECRIMGELLKSLNTPIPAPAFSSVNLANQYYSYLITRKSKSSGLDTSVLVENPQNGPDRTQGPPTTMAEKKLSLKKLYGEGKARPMTAREAFDFLGLDSVEAEIKYRHLIETEDMPNLGKTAYKCKEHPKIWDTSLRGLEVSHLIPEHEEVSGA